MRKHKDTGFYMGTFFPNKDSLWRHDCVAVALGNYLTLYKISQKVIDDIITDLINDPKYIDSIGGVKLYDTPMVIEDILKKHIGGLIEVILYLGGTNDIPDKMTEKVKNVEIGKEIGTPAIVVTHNEDSEYYHFWVLTNEHRRIDNDGLVCYKLLQICGQLEIWEE